MIVRRGVNPLVINASHASSTPSTVPLSSSVPRPQTNPSAMSPENAPCFQSESVPGAIDNLREATELYLEEFPLQKTGQALLTTFEVAAHA